MSDAPEGDDWWQASDLRWYPPADRPGRSRRAVPWLASGAALVVVALIAAGMTFVVAGGDDEVGAATVRLEPVEETGPDPFTESVSITEVAEFPDSVQAVVGQTSRDLPVDEATGTLEAPGATPGLYGGTRDDSACDVEALRTFLTDDANAEKAGAWADAAGISTEEIPARLDALTPTVLTLDTRVTNNGFSDGAATPRQSVLQAGSAVLVDDLGVPRVRCSCGNPLSEPTELDLAAATTTGTTWASFQASSTVTPAPSDRAIETFTLTDTTTGDTFQQPVAAASSAEVDGLHVAVSRNFDPTDGTFRGGIHTSADGGDWETVLDTTPLAGIAEHDGTLVAVGTQATDGSIDGPGVVLTSTDGSTWSEPTTVPDALQDVTHAEDRWLAVGNRRTGNGPTEGVVYESTDASRWEELTTIPDTSGGYEEVDFESIAAGDGQLALTGSTCLGDSCFTELFVSSDAVSWDRVPQVDGAAGSPGSLTDLAFSDGTWAGIGFSGNDFSGYRSLSGSGADPTSIALGPLTPGGVEVSSVAPAGAGWIAAGSQDQSTSEISRSDDMRSWSRLGAVDAAVSDLVVVDSGD